MNLYKLTLEIKSPVITPFQADTIFGHFSWALRYLKGERRLIEFLEGFNANSTPLLVSDGLPQGFLPKPILKPPNMEEIERLIIKYFGGDIKSKVRGFTALKKMRKQLFISCDMFRELNGNLTYLGLYEKVFDCSYCPLWFRERPCKLDILTCPVLSPESQERYEIPKFESSELVAHNTISRMTGRVIEPGGFFGEIETYHTPDTKFEIYIKGNYFSPDDLQEIFQFIAQSGYGKDKSTGKGQLETKELIEFSFGEPQNSNAFMSLSSFIPEKDDPINGYYELLTKYGKLGGDYAKSGFDSKRLNPFKKPLIMLKSGSTFFTTNGEKEFYGQLLENIHQSDKIKHYGYAFPLRIKME